MEVAETGGSRWLPLADAFLGPGKSAIDQHRSLITRLRFRPTEQREGSAFFRVMRPQGVALPMISMAARLRLDETGRVAAVRIAVGPAGPVPYLATEAMAALEGRRAAPAPFEDATETLLDNIPLRASKYRATREYREEMLRSHLPGVLATAAGRAAQAAGDEGSGG